MPDEPLDRDAVAALGRIHRALVALRERRRPTGRILVAPRTAGGSVAIVSGAFDPPTRAHAALADAALRHGAGVALFALGTVTLDKRSSGLALEDRLRLLGELAERNPRLGVVVHNAGLYADQATAILTAAPAARDPAFVVGLDKLPQILDARYYDDLERGLERLLSRARLWVAPRGRGDRRTFESLRSLPAAARWRERIEWLPLERRWRDVSATAVRAALRGGGDPDHLLPDGWAARLVALGAYDPRRRRRYRERVRRIREGERPRRSGPRPDGEAPAS